MCPIEMIYGSGMRLHSYLSHALQKEMALYGMQVSNSYKQKYLIFFIKIKLLIFVIVNKQSVIKNNRYNLNTVLYH